MLFSSEIKKHASEIGFSACGIAPAEAVSSHREKEYKSWLKNGNHAEMEYLARNVDKKLNPCLLVEGAKTVVSLAVNYYPGKIREEENKEEVWHLARYAYGTDYHEVIKEMLHRLMASLCLKEPVDGRCFVDTAPVDEKYWAVRCGLGWRGRNSQIIIPHMGSFFFLGELILTHEVDTFDSPIKKGCGKCHACIDVCPTHALNGDGTLDARLCLSYLTIEYKGNLPKKIEKAMGNCFYGCDRCAEVCPWNIRFAKNTAIADFLPRKELLAMKPTDWKKLTLEQYQKLFRKSAVKRAKFTGLMRNIQALSRKENNKE